MQILALGDVIGRGAVRYLAANLWRFREAHRIDFTVINAENASFLAGVGKEAGELLLSSGADVLTGGNHTLQNRAAYDWLDAEPRVLRPLNFPCDVPGSGYTVLTVCGYRILVMNAMGTVMIEPVPDNPWGYIERALEREAGAYDVALLDFHAEATGEKVALARYFDGRFAAVFGTHTHIPTADMQVLPNGTGYVTDLGACAPSGGVLGVDADVMVERLRRKVPLPYREATGPVRCEGVIFDVDESCGKCRGVTRVAF